MVINIGFLDVFKKQEVASSVTELQYLQNRLSAWLMSPQRKEMEKSRDYYEGKQDILNRQRTVINETGNLTPVQNLPNAQIVDNQFRKLVDQKTNYALGKPITIATDNEAYSAELTKVFDKTMMMKMRDLAQEAVIGGIAYLHPYYDGEGNFKVKVFDSYEFMPIWLDSDHDDLLGGVRVYDVEYYDQGVTKRITRAEVYSKSGIDRYLLQGHSLVNDPTRPHDDYLKFEETGFNWEKLPIIPFRYNSDEIPLLRSVKSQQDYLNITLSNMANMTEEDPRNSILILKNYDGQDLASFRHNLANYGTVKVRSVDGVQGGVDVLNIDTDPSSYESLIKQLRRSIIENGRGFDAKDEKMEGDLNMLNISSAYVDIDLDVDAMETEFQRGFEELKWFLDKWLIHIGKGDFTEETVEFVFNRNIFINQDAMITNCVNSQGIISDETIIAHHPWVVDLNSELKKIEVQKAEEMEREQQQLASISNAGSTPAKEGE